MVLNLVVNSNNLDDLLAITAIDESLLSKACDIFNKKDPPLVKPSDLEDEIRKLGFNEKAEPTIRQLISLSSLARENNISSSETVDSVLAALNKGESDDHSNCFSQLSKKNKIFKDLLQSKSVVNVMKAIELSFDFDNFLDKFRTITDFRPVYSEGSDLKISSWVVTQTLRINYTNSSGPNTLSIAADEKDLQEIIDKCKRALKKSKELKEYSYKHRLGNILVAGEEKLK